MQPQQIQVDLSKTTGITCQNCGSHFFDQTILIRKISRLLTGSPEDQMTLVPVFICKECKQPLKEFFPAGMNDVELALGLTKVQDLKVVDDSSTFKLYT